MKAIVGGTILLPEGAIRGKALLFDEWIRGIVSPEDARCSIRISLSHVNRPDEIDEAAHKIIDCACAIRTL